MTPCDMTSRQSGIRIMNCLIFQDVANVFVGTSEEQLMVSVEECQDENQAQQQQNSEHQNEQPQQKENSQGNGPRDP